MDSYIIYQDGVFFCSLINIIIYMFQNTKSEKYRILDKSY